MIKWYECETQAIGTMMTTEDCESYWIIFECFAVSTENCRTVLHYETKL